MNSLDNQLGQRPILGQWKFLISIILIATMMRVPLTVVGPLMGDIKADLMISNTVAGLLTTIPLIIFGLVSPYVIRIVQLSSLRHTVFIAIILIFLGLLIRVMGDINMLIAGTILIAIGIAFTNVAMPSFVMLKFPFQIGIITGIYSTTMNLVSGLGSGFAVPIAHSSEHGYKFGLGIWAALALVALIVWIRQLFLNPKTLARFVVNREGNKFTFKNVAKSKLAWAITALFGGQSIIFYSLVAWAPTMLVDKGISLHAAGYYFMALQLIVIPTTFVFPMLIAKLEKQKIIAYLIGAFFLFGFLLFFTTNAILLFIAMLLIGAGIGASFSSCMALFALKAETHSGSIGMSGFAQSVGYIFAAIGPILMGLLFDLFNSTNMNIIIFLVIGLISFVATIVATEKTTIEASLSHIK